jgi:hypothetical protein
MVSHKRKHDRQDIMQNESLAARPQGRPSMMFDHENNSASPIPPRIDTTMLQEAARKVLANIPSSVAAAALPRNFNSLTPNTDSPSLVRPMNPASIAASNSFTPAKYVTLHIAAISYIC